jgi:hypothetical protein
MKKNMGTCKNKNVRVQKQSYLIIAIGMSPVPANTKKTRPGKKLTEALYILLAAAPIAELPTVSIIPAPMNTIAYSFASTNLVNFVRSTGIVIKDRLPIQAATKAKEKQ